MSTGTIDFLKNILPEKGMYCLWERGTKKHIWFNTIEDMAETAVKMAVEGKSIYHACSSFNNKHRTQERVEAVRSLWVDIDTGPLHSKPSRYPDDRSALVEVFGWCKSNGMPLPTIVQSGHGLHCYWPLEHDLTLDEWKPIAEAFKRSISASIDIDPVRTCDAASLLRPVGTFNYKEGAETRPVRTVNGMAHPLALDLARSKFQVQALPVGLPPAGGPMIFDLGKMKSSDPKPPSFAAEIVKQCGQLARMRDLRGVMSEPEWYRCLGVLAQCEDGEKYAHEWSSGYPGYSPAETAGKLMHARGVGPTLCTTFGENTPAACAMCPHRGHVKSPIQLGRSAEPVITSLNGHIGPLPALPWPYFWGNTGALCCTMLKSDGTERTVVVTQHPIKIDRVVRSSVDGVEHLVVANWLPGNDGGWEEQVLPYGELRGPGVVPALASHSVNVQADAVPQFTKFLSSMRDKVLEEKGMGSLPVQFGWQPNGEFLIGTTMLSVGGKSRKVSVDAALVQRARHLAPQPGADAKTWWNTAANLFQPGQEDMSTVVLASLASPLMRWAAADITGMMLLLVGASGTGKTYAQEVAASLWGHKDATTFMHRDTVNAQFGHIKYLGNLPAMMNDLKDIPIAEAKDFVVALTEGREKHRMNKAASLVVNTLRWKNITIGNTNQSMCQHIGTEAEQAMGMRVLEIPSIVDRNVQYDGGEQLQIMLNNAGAAIREWIWLVMALEEKGIVSKLTKNALDYASRELQTEGRGSAPNRYIITLVAVLLVASKILSSQFIKYDHPRVVAYIMDAAKKHLAFVTSTAGNANNILADYINDNCNSILIMPGPARTSAMQVPIRMPTNKLFIRIEECTQTMYVSRGAVRYWLKQRHHNFKAIEKELTDCGIMRDAGLPKALGGGTELATGATPCWVINLAHPLMAGVVENAGK